MGRVVSDPLREFLATAMLPLGQTRSVTTEMFNSPFK